jgi:amino acid adenylation domain-containing protein
MDVLADARDLFSAIDARAALHPGKAAMRFAGDELTYVALRRGSNRLARRLRALGVSRGDCVACCVERGGHSLLAVLGILKSGATLVPLDESNPRDRLDYICTQNRIAVVVSDGNTLQRIAGKLDMDAFRAILVDVDADVAAQSDDDLAAVHAPEDIAYIIYTSGSTGRPKGVRIPHRALYRSIVDGVPAIRMRGDDVCAQLAALTFDAAIWEHLAPLYCGATLVCAPGQALATPDAWADFVARNGITWTYLPPAFFAQLMAQARGRQDKGELEALGCLRCILFAGEALPAALVREWQAVMGTRVTLMNFYGPTETTVLVSGHVIDYLLPERAEAVPIGRPFGQNRLCLLDEALRPCQPGAVGSLYIGGPQLAAGYVGDTESTARSFIVDSRDSSAVLYDSGDLAFLRPNGDYVFVGRRDNQVKLRGKRIELEEVEKHLQGLPGVSAAAAFLDEAGEVKRLVACVSADVSVRGNELKAQLGDIAPDYMVPHEIVVHSSLPLNANGKIDRRVIREQYAAERARSGTAEIASDTDPLERIWRQVLGCAEVGEHEHFFAVGGDSLLLFRALSLARQRGYDVSDIAGVLAENTLAGWRRCLQLRGEAPAPAVRLDARVYPLAPMQREMFLLSEAHPGRNLYHIQFVFESEPFESAVLERAFRHVIRCHPITRTVFREVDGELQNVELDPAVAEDFRLATVHLDGEKAEGALRAWMRENHAIAFDTDTFPLLRAAYLTAGERCHLAFTFFHPLFDGWSFSLFVLQVCEAYEALARGEPAPEFAPRGRFADYVGLLAERQTSALAQAEAAYWRTELRAPLPLLEMAPQALSAGLERRALYLEADERLAAALKRLAASRGTTLHKVLLTVYFMLFQRLSGQREMLIGNTVMGRPLEMEDADRVLGCFINILPIRIGDAAQSFDALLGEVTAKMDAALVHGRMANEWHVHNILAEEKHIGMSWRVIFALDNFPESFVINQLHWPPYSWNAIEPFDIALSVIDLRGRLYCYWNYRSDLFPEPQIRAIGERYITLLSELCGLAGGAL